MPAEKLNCNLSIVTTGVSDVNPTLILTTDTSKFFFNVGEGTQRLCGEHKIKLIKLDTIFITECTVECLGGLPGMLLTLADKHISAHENRKEQQSDQLEAQNYRKKDSSLSKSKEHKTYGKRKVFSSDRKTIHTITVHGPPGLKKLFHSMRSSFLRRDAIYFNIVEHDLSSQRGYREGEKPSSDDTEEPRNNEIGSLDENGLKTIFLNEELKIKALVQRVSNPKQADNFQYDDIEQGTRENANDDIDDTIENHRKRQRLMNSYDRKKNDFCNQRYDRSQNLNMNINSFQPSYMKYKYTVSYFVETASVAGKFQVDKAIKLGVPKGPLYGMLKSGKTVTLNDGRKITPDQCVDPSTPPVKVAIFSCPSEYFLDDSKDEKPEEISFFEIQTKRDEKPKPQVSSIITSILTKMDCVVHLAPFNVLQTDNYCQKYVRIMKTKIDHMIEEKANHNRLLHLLLSQAPGTHRSPFRASRLASIRLNKLCPNNWKSPPTYSKFNSQIESDENIEVVLGDHLMQYNLTPYHSRGLVMKNSEAKNEIKLDGTEINYAKANNVDDEHDNQYGSYDNTVYKSLLDISQVEVNAVEKEVSDAIQSYNKILQRTESDQQELIEESSNKSKTSVEISASFNTSSNGKLTFFGTGCAIPSKLRNVTGIFLEVPTSPEWATRLEGEMKYPLESAILMDAGEGTFGQMCNIFDLHRKKEDLDNKFRIDQLSEKLIMMSLIWISHPHADHHLGVLRILKEREKILNNVAKDFGYKIPPLVIIAPDRLLTWFLSSASVDTGVDLRNRGKYLLHNISNELPSQVQQILAMSIGLERLKSFRVRHCEDAYGVALYLKNIGKVVFSGDTAPCRQLIENGQNADILIHEATFDDSKSSEAMEKGHSTISQAIDAGRRMNAKGIILTHFSQRYPNFPNFLAGNEVERQDSSSSSPVQEDSFSHRDSPGQMPLENSGGNDDKKRINRKLSKEMPVVVAFDRMEMKFNDLPELFGKTPIMHHLFPMMEEED